MSASSSSYVPMRPVEFDEEVRPSPVKVLTKGNCEHVATVCEVCVKTWRIDYKIFFTRTVGGRRLFNKMTDYPNQENI